MSSQERMQNDVDTYFTHLTSKIVAMGKRIDTRNAKTYRLRNMIVAFTKTPLVTIRRTAWKNALREFEWFMSGSNDINDLHPKVKHWWEPWANEDGFVHNNYSKQFRSFDGDFDQIEYMIDTLKNDHGSRRNVITTWHTKDMVSDVTPITNCHGSLIQAFVEEGKLHLTMHQRSCDMMLGVPHNWIQYWAFMMYLAHHSGLEMGSLTWIGGDCHIYPDHVEMVKKARDLNMEKRYTYEVPNLIYNPTSKDFKADDFSLDIEYKPLIKESLKMTV